MTWEIVVGIIALVGFIGTFVGAAWKVSATLSSLNVTIQMLKDLLDQLKAEANETHNEFYDKLDDHERRIGRLEDFKDFGLNQ